MDLPIKRISAHAWRGKNIRYGHIAYVAKSPKVGYDPFLYKTTLVAADVEISEDVFIITAEEAEKHRKPSKLTNLLIYPSQTQLKPNSEQAFTIE